MHLKNYLLAIVFLGICLQLGAQQNWFVGPNGMDISANGKSVLSPFATITYAVEFVQPGDTIQVLAGTYYNSNFGSGDIWNSESTVKINDLHGEEQAYIYIKPYQNDKVVLKGDGLCLFRLRNSSFIQIEGFEMYGEVENISLQTALDYQFIYKDSDDIIHYRVPPGTAPEVVGAMSFPVLTDITRPNYTDTKGIYTSGSHHINIINNLIHHTPGVGLRVASGDYITIVGNDVHNCSRKSYSGTHGLVVSESVSIDDKDDYKIIIAQNTVHENYNEIYSWAPSKTFITPHIDEGKGISLQKNSIENGWTHGRFLVVNNITYWNGFAGIHNNSGERMDFINNTCYYNSFTGNGNNIGMSTAGGKDIKFINNIVVTDPNLSGFTISVANTQELTVKNNLTFGHTDPDVNGIERNAIKLDPLFMDADNFNFHLQENSPAINSANINNAPSFDYFGNPRDLNPDLGAIEYIVKTSTTEIDSKKIAIYPNPFTTILNVERKDLTIEDIELFNLLGQNCSKLLRIHKSNHFEIDTQALQEGLYILKLKDESIIVYKSY